MNVNQEPPHFRLNEIEVIDPTFDVWQGYSPATSEQTTLDADFNSPTFVESSGSETPSSPTQEQPQGNIYTRYSDIITGGFSAYHQAKQALSEQRATIEPKLAKIYETFPYLSPHNLQLMGQGEQTYLTDINLLPNTAGITPEEKIGQLARHFDRDNPDAWQDELAAAVAASSVRQFRGAETHKEYVALLAHPIVQKHVPHHLINNLGLFTCGGIQDLHPDEFQAFGLTLGDLESLPAEAPELATLPRPPLHLTQLAVDISLHNADSTLPYGPRAKFPGMGKNRPLQGNATAAQNVISALNTYLMRRYEYSQMPDKQMLSVLAECDLAERQGFLEASSDEQYRVAHRVKPIFSKLKSPDHIPQAARPIFDACQDINYASRLS